MEKIEEKTEVKDKTWYLAIMKTFNHYSIFVGAYGEQYRSLITKDAATRNGIEIVAEQFGITDEEINILNGFTKDGKPSERNYLKNLDQEMNFRIIQDPQKALEDLVNLVRSKSG